MYMFVRLRLGTGNLVGLLMQYLNAEMNSCITARSRTVAIPCRWPLVMIRDAWSVFEVGVSLDPRQYIVHVNTGLA